MSSNNFSFELTTQDDRARLGKIITSRGIIDTPAFMPVGTQGTVKGVFPEDIEKTNTQIILGNTYHLLLRPGIDVLKKFKGSIVLSAAAYNAGPGTINRWLKNYGDPRKFGVDPLIWIEMIPYHETRNYVKRVLSNDLIYRHKISHNILKFDRARKNFGHKF